MRFWPGTEVMVTGKASPMDEGELTTISRHASATMAPPEYASGLIHATVLSIDEALMALVISRTAPTSPPGELMSMTRALAPPSSAASIRRRTDMAVMASIGPSIVITTTLSAWR